MTVERQKTSAEISLRDARRIALAAQGFAARRPAGRIDRRHFRRVLDTVATVQLDSVNVLTRSHELVFFARLGPYDRAALTRWLWSSRELFEYWGHEASVHPVQRYPLLRWRMDGDHRWGGIRKAAAQHPDLVDDILRAVQDKGPLTIGELQALNGDGRRGESWWGWSTTKQVVEHLFWKGQVAATRRNGFDRVYLPLEKWLPDEVLSLESPTAEAAQSELILLAARSLGIGTARDIADYFRLPVVPTRALLETLVAEDRLVPARVEGWQQPAYLHPEAKVPGRRLRARALLSPFDSLVWERDRTERLWGFRYRIEIYVPAAKRVHGYYVLPFLLDEMLVGRVDLKADRQASVLRVRAAWVEEAEGNGAGRRQKVGEERDRIAAELAITLAELAAWLGLTEGIDVEPKGDLSPLLAHALA